MKNEVRHEMNEGSQATVKALRGRFTTLARKGLISEGTLFLLRAEIRSHIKENSQRKGGLGRK